MLNVDELLLVQLAEEAAEVTQEASKVLRFGLETVEPNKMLTNKVNLSSEIMDFMALVRVLEERDLIDISTLEDHIVAKKAKILKFMDVSRELNRLEKVNKC